MILGTLLLQLGDVGKKFQIEKEGFEDSSEIAVSSKMVIFF